MSDIQTTADPMLSPADRDRHRAAFLRAKDTMTRAERAELAEIDTRLPPAGYGNEPLTEAEANRQLGAGYSDPKPAVPAMADPDSVHPSALRFAALRDKTDRTPAEDTEFAELGRVAGLAPAPDLAPLTPAEVGKLAEQRADPAQQPDPDLAAREGVPLPLPEREPRDPAKALPALYDVVGHMAALLAAIVSVVPVLHNNGARVQQMRDALDLLVYHATPESEAPPPAHGQPAEVYRTEERPSRISVLSNMPSRTAEQEAELSRLLAT